MCLDGIEAAQNSYHFVFHLLKYRGFNDVISGSAQPQIVGNAIKRVKITLPELKEQQKIADCLSSLDDLITLESQKLNALKTHKKGLMQQLFPAEGETVPRLRFPEFREAGEWNRKLMSEVYSFRGNNSLSRANLNYESGLIKNIHYGDIHTKFSTLFDISKESVPYINAPESQDLFKNMPVNLSQQQAGPGYVPYRH
jgi:type I restriction enzyme S subunit